METSPSYVKKQPNQFIRKVHKFVSLISVVVFIRISFNRRVLILLILLIIRNPLSVVKNKEWKDYSILNVFHVFRIHMSSRLKMYTYIDKLVVCLVLHLVKILVFFFYPGVRWEGR